MGERKINSSLKNNHRVGTGTLTTTESGRAGQRKRKKSTSDQEEVENTEREKSNFRDKHVFFSGKEETAVRRCGRTGEPLQKFHVF